MSQVGKYLNLKPHMSSWRVYNQNGPYTTAYAIGSLAPAQFGGLSYRIRGEKGNNVYLIQTESFGLCAIWAPRDNDSTITSLPTYSQGDISGTPKDITKAIKDLVVKYTARYYAGWSTISQSIENIYNFYNLVRNNGLADLKNQGWTDTSYVFDGAIYRNDASGNILYGQLGKIFGFSDEILLRAAGYAQVIAGTSKPEWGTYTGSSPYGDDPYDQYCIQIGIAYYRNNYR